MLQIYLLGPMRLLFSGEPFILSGLPKTRLLLAYLLLNRSTPLGRDEVAFQLWPDVSEQEARANLRRHLYDLQQALPPAAEDNPWLVRTQKTIQWNLRAPFWLDVAAFEGLQGTPERLGEAVGLYAGELLAREDEEWLAYERGRLRALFLRKLQELVQAYRDRGEYAKALTFVEQALAGDPLDEEMVRTCMWLRYAVGDRTGALGIYRSFCAQLQTELDLPPMPETEALATQIAQQSFDGIAKAETQQAIQRAERTPTGTPARYVPPQTPLPNAAPVPTNLPAPLRHLLGREQEMKSLVSLLLNTADGARLITLTGPAGVGKTRLSVEVARAVHASKEHPFADGVFFVGLVSITEADLLITSLADVLGVSLPPEAPPLDTLIEALRYKRLLLVIDNFEHLMDAAGLLDALLTAVSGLHLLVTSQASLNLYGEVVVRVDPLMLPTASQATNLSEAEVKQSPAVTLFCEVAHAVNAQFYMTEANRTTIVEICRRLDGMPLAIELAAAWVKLLPPARILVQLSDRLNFLTSKLRNIPERHRSLRAAIEWSYNLLDAEEQRLFTRLSLFADSFTPRSVAAVIFGRNNGKSDYVLLARLASLVEKNIVYQLPNSDGDKNKDNIKENDEERFAMLSTLRDYAWERLQEDAGRAVLQDGAVNYFAEWVSEQTQAWRTEHQQPDLSSILAEENNLRLALSWAATQDASAARLEAGARLAVSLGVVWETTARFYEAVESLRPILARRAELSAPVRVALLNEAGRFFRYGGDNKEALLKLHEEALREAHLLEDVHLLLDTLDVYAISANESGEIALAAQVWSEAIELARTEAPPLRLGHLLNNAATSYTMMGQPEQATTLLEESLAIARQAQGRDRIFGALINLSNAARLADNPVQDQEYLSQAVPLAETTKNRTLRIVFLSAAAESALYHKDFPMSAILHSALQAICQQVNMAWPVRYQQEFAGYMTQTQAHIDEAIYPRLIQQGARFTLDQAIERVAIWLEEGRRTVDGGRTKG